MHDPDCHRATNGVQLLVEDTREGLRQPASEMTSSQQKNVVPIIFSASTLSSTTAFEEVEATTKTPRNSVCLAPFVSSQWKLEKVSEPNLRQLQVMMTLGRFCFKLVTN